jgi:ABC-type glycerol-3-phosphate transport system substrate-binding protein
MKPLVDTGTIEPWTPYITEELKADLIPAAIEEGTYAGDFYVWPMVLDICVQAHHAGIIEQAGLDPEVLPTTWDELIANAQKVKDSGAAPNGVVFDNRDWRSLIPITHSFSTDDIYSPDGLFIYTSEPAIQALEIMKRMMELTIPDILASMSVDNTDLPDEATWAAEGAGYFFKYQNAPLFFSAPWPDPSQLRMAKLPSQEGTAGSTVFWSTGIGLLKYGANKEKMVDFVESITYDQRLWQQSVAGIPEEAQPPAGQMPETLSIWDEWRNTPPDYVQANQWVYAIGDSLATAKAIQPTALAITQFEVARPEWHKYLSGEVADAKTAMTNAYDAVRAEFKKVTGVDAQ